MSNFDFSESLPRNVAVDYPLVELRGNMVLQVLYAGEANKPYFNALLRENRHNVRKLRGAVTPKFAEELRARDVELYAQHIVVGWRDVLNKDGQVVEFSQEACADLLRALPTFVFDGLRGFCSTASNFSERELDQDEEDEELSGN